jgi:hypothetical protein
MTTLVLQSAGGAVGGFLGGPLGALFGRAIGGALGASLDRSLFGGTSTVKEGSRLTEMSGLTSTEGAAIPRVYGRVRLGGQIIWATRFQESVTETQNGGGGKGGGSSSDSTNRTYSYTANLAIGLCEGEIGYIRRIWANGKRMDWTGLNLRVYRGDETQMPDPLIVAKEGTDNAPAYRGLAYIVFEGLPLADYGNRVPQFSFEIVKPVPGVGDQIRSVNLIPGAGEFVYDTIAVTTSDGSGTTANQNRHELTHSSDFLASLDQLLTLCPNLTSVQLVVTWFGDDLRCDTCTIAPRVDAATKSIVETQWQVNGLSRAQARLVSFVDGAPAYGGTPSDASILRAIRYLKSLGIAVTFYPFVMMDIPQGNALPDPYQIGATQPAYPWRGRIICNPAPGIVGSPNGSVLAGQQIQRFFGLAKASQFSASSETVSYSGPSEWSWRRMVLHYATLCSKAGGVDAFLIGSELVGLTGVESTPGVFPTVGYLSTLAADVKSILGSATKIVYGADWTEYAGRTTVSGDLRFPLDPLWASSSIDAIGIDVYWPISDWRNGTSHLDYALARSSSDRDYLRQRFASGEAYDWYYASDADRLAQNRRAITDGLANKPWVWRAKDLVNWWSNVHKERVAGKELATPTAWKPYSKPIWFTEFGCPAVDRGANGPNAFPDSKSSEDALPPFSRGTRDDLVQLRYIDAVTRRFDPSLDGFRAGDNPVSPLDGRRMVDPNRLSVWAWDARPFPAFPSMSGVWSDAQNWRLGHWLNGRLEGAPMDGLVAAILRDFGVAADQITLDGFIDGYVISTPSSARVALEPLAALYRFDGLASSGQLRFIGHDTRKVVSLTSDDVIADKNGALATVTFAQESELPREIRIGFSDSENDYRLAMAASRRLAVTSKRETTSDPSVVTTRAEAQRLADFVLHDAWAGRQSAKFSIRPGLMALEPGDCVALDAIGYAGIFRITRITDRGVRDIEAQSVDGLGSDFSAGTVVPIAAKAPSLPGKPNLVVVDLPIVKGDAPVLQALAAFADPWPGSLTVWRSPDGANWSRFGAINRPATMGVTLSALGPGPVWRWDTKNSVTIMFGSGELSSPGDISALAGDIPLGLQGADGKWEVIAFAQADLVGEKTWRLSRLLRGLGGSEPLAARSLAAGARAVVLDGALLPIVSGSTSVGAAWNWRVVASAYDYMHPTAVGLATLAGGDALKPLSPINASAKRTSAGVVISFMRRARMNADAWEPADIPLDERLESYEMDIYKNGTVIRTLSGSSGPILTYPSALELSDFGTVQTILTVRLYQISDVVGRGMPLAVTLPIF